MARMRRSDPVTLRWTEDTSRDDDGRPSGTERTMQTWAEPVTAAVAVQRSIDLVTETPAAVLRIAAPTGGDLAVTLTDPHLSSLRVDWRSITGRRVVRVVDPDGRRRWLDLHLT